MSDAIEILMLRGIGDKATRRPGQRQTISWTELAGMLTKHTILADKRKGRGFSPLTMADAPCTCGGEKCCGELGHFIAENVLAFNALMLDIDKYRADDRQLDQAGAELAMARLRALKLRYAVYSTHSHRFPDRASLRAAIALSRPVTIEEWPLFFPAVTAWLDIEHDAKCSETIGRFWYLPACSAGTEPIAYEHDGQPVDVDAIMSIAGGAQAAIAAKEAQRPRLAPTRPYVSRGGEFRIRDMMAEKYPGVRGETGGRGVDTAWHIGGDCPWQSEHTSSSGSTSTTVFLYTSGAWEFICQHSHCRGRNHEDFRQFHQPDWVPFDERLQQPPRTRRSDGTPPPQDSTAERQQVESESTGAEQTGDVHPNAPGGGDFERSAEGKIVHSQRNMRLAVAKLGVRLRYNLMSLRSEICGLSGFGPDLNDAAVNHLWLAIDEQFGFRTGYDLFWRFVENEARANRYHPVREYLDGLHWDGVPRLDGWLTRYGGADDTPYTQAVGTLVLLAAVRRVRHPGCKFDEMLILESPAQGKGKSTALRILAAQDEWFTDRFPMGESDRIMMEATLGRWIVEAGELHGMSKTAETWLKGYLSAAKDVARPAYARKDITAPRQFVIIGTTNETEGYLTDSTGNRRFWPVRIREFNIPRLCADRDQLWAEAAAREAAGASIRLDPALYAAAAAEQEGRRQASPMEIALSDQLGDYEGRISSTDVWRLTGIQGRPATQQEVSQIGKAMKRLGWGHAQRRIGGGRRVWFYTKGNAGKLLELGLLHGQPFVQPSQRFEADDAGSSQDSMRAPGEAQSRGGRV